MVTQIDSAMDGLRDPQLQRFVAAETQKQAFQAAVHTLTEECWDKCVTDRPGQRLGGSTEVGRDRGYLGGVCH